ncbi:MAG: branched-chain amino acid aminotransferase [Candidatus Hodarchaeales archaeon]|jgi:branched-chain amino acid aminotransferase
MSIETIPENELKKKYEHENSLEFGRYFTDRMFQIKYANGEWGNSKITKYGSLQLEPSAIALQYGQTIFEGQKAYRTKEGKLNLFRPDLNIQRFNNSAKRMAMPEIAPDIYMGALKTLLDLEREWAPKNIGSALYIRPTMIGTQGRLGVVPSDEYLFYIILSPVGPYFPEGFQPIKIWVSENYIRAAPGGTGYAKTGGNYAASLLIGQEAFEKGYSQVLWLDAIHKKYVEEVGAMNIFFVYNDTLYTASLDSGTILPGLTRASVIQMAQDFGYSIEEKALSMNQIVEGVKDGLLQECFGAGTAASIAPVGCLHFQGKEHIINDFKIGRITQQIYDRLIGIQYGSIDDPYNWIVSV